MSYKKIARLEITSNNGETAIFRDLTTGEVGTFERVFCGATRKEFLKDLAPGSIKEAEATVTRSDRVARKVFNDLSALARQARKKE